jgi:hypothetical protein
MQWQRTERASGDFGTLILEFAECRIGGDAAYDLPPAGANPAERTAPACQLGIDLAASGPIPIG